MRAADRVGVSLSDWARRRLDELADEELGTDEPPAPSKEDIAEGLKAIGSLKSSGLRERVQEARKTPWTVG